MKKTTKYEMQGLRYELRLSWMDFAVTLLLQGHSGKECKEKIATFVAGEDTNAGARGKAQIVKIQALVSKWYKPPKYLIPFRDYLLGVARQIPRSDWPILHWCILSAAYPFFANLSMALGRLFYLQGQLNKAQIKNRLEQIYGVKPHMDRNLRYTIQTLSNFKMLTTDHKSGLYSEPETRFSTNFETTAALWKAVLLATKGGRMALVELQNFPGFYPFNMTKICLEQFKAAFTDVDYQQYATCGEQVFLKDVVD